MSITAETILFNEEPYKVDIQIYNNSGAGLAVTYKSISNIKIYENLYDPFFSAEITYEDDAHAIEKGSNIESGVTNKIKFIPLGYNYRGDGHDIVHICILPASEQVGSLMCFDGIFSVVKSFRVYDTVNKKWMKTLILRDYWYHLLSEQQSYFTTFNKNVTHPEQRSNLDRSQYTGEAIVELIKHTINNDDLIDYSKWDLGGSRIFYSAGVNEKALTTLMNLYKLHNSYADSVNDKCYLSHNISNDKWELMSLAKMYENAIIKKDGSNFCGVMHMDRINLENSDDASVSEISKYTPINALVSPHAGDATYYDFKDIETADAINLNSHAVYNYNTTNKEFVIDMKEGNLSNFREFFYNNYTSKMIGKNNQPYPNIPLTQKKLANITLNNVFNLYDTANISFGRNQMIDIANILNNGIEVSTHGSALRHPGSFISIDSRTSGTSNDFNSKIYGDYLIVSAEHNFTDNLYTTNLICTKPYVYERSKSDPEVPIVG